LTFRQANLVGLDRIEDRDQAAALYLAIAAPSCTKRG